MSKPTTKVHNLGAMTDRQYLKQSAAVCPVCQSTQIASETVDADGASGSANVTCTTCGSQWVDIWRVTGYDNLNEGMSEVEIEAIETKVEKVRKDKENQGQGHGNQGGKKK